MFTGWLLLMVIWLPCWFCWPGSSGAIACTAIGCLRSGHCRACLTVIVAVVGPLVGSPCVSTALSMAGVTVHAALSGEPPGPRSVRAGRPAASAACGCGDGQTTPPARASRITGWPLIRAVPLTLISPVQAAASAEAVSTSCASRTPPPSVCGGQVTPGGRPFDGQVDVAGEAVAPPGEDGVRLAAALAERAGVGPLVGVGRHHEPEVRLVGRDADAVELPRPGHGVGQLAADLHEELAVGRGREPVRGGVLGAREEFRAQRIHIVLGRLVDGLLGGVADDEVHQGRRPEAVAEDFDVVNVALLGGEGVPVAVADLLEASGDLTRRRHLLGRLRRVVGVVVEHDGGAGEGQQEGVRRAGVVLDAVLEAVEAGDDRRQVAAERQPADGRRVARGGDGGGELFQNVIVHDGGGVGLAARQVAAVDRHRRRLAGFEHGGVNGVDPRGGGDREAVEVFGRAAGDVGGVGELVEADV